MRRAVLHRAALVAALAVTFAASTARADQALERQLPPPTWSYLYDGGAIPFAFLPLATALGLRMFAEPPPEPRGFSPDEGGATFQGDTVSEISVAIYALGVGGVIAMTPRDARWHHLKGFAEASMTTLALTETAKNTFGRRRPHWQNNAILDDRRSFFSGHSSVTFGTSTYLALYLNRHVFARWRDPGARFAWWEAVPYAGLAAGSIVVAASRVDDNRHHPSDVITGAVVGTAAAAGFFWYQERRYQRARASQRERSRWTVAPTLDRPGLTVRATF